MSTVKYKGPAFLRQRIACAVLSGRPVTITNIRPDDEVPGLLDHEVAYLRLVDKITNGSRVDINETGTTVHFRPGFVVGGRVSHDCGNERGIGYFIEGILHMCVFAKRPVSGTFTGITNCATDLSIDILRLSLVPILKAFGIETAGFVLKVKRRGVPPGGAGVVEFACPVVRELRAIDFCEEGLVKRVRGVSYALKVSPQIANRMVQAARGVLMDFLPDVFIHTDHVGSKEVSSPGYGVSLQVETTSGCMAAIERVAEKGTLPEDLGKAAAEMLMLEASKGGCVDSGMQTFMFLFMILTPEDVSKVRLGPLTKSSEMWLKHINDFFGATFKVKQDRKVVELDAEGKAITVADEGADEKDSVPAAGAGGVGAKRHRSAGGASRAKDVHGTSDTIEFNTVLVSCMGLGYRNLAKKVT